MDRFISGWFLFKPLFFSPIHAHRSRARTPSNASRMNHASIKRSKFLIIKRAQTPPPFFGHFYFKNRAEFGTALKTIHKRSGLSRLLFMFCFFSH